MFFSLRYKLALLASVLLVAGVGIASWLMFAQSTRALETEIRKRGEVLAETLARSARVPLLEQDDLNLSPLVRNAGAEPGILAARILDGHGVVVASSIESETSRDDARMTHPRRTSAGPPMRDLGTERLGGTLIIASRLSFKDVDLGEAQVVMDLQGITAPLIAEARRDVALLAGALLVVGLGIAVALSQRITRPLRNLRLAVNALGHGDTTARVQTDTNDELGELGQAFNEMMESLGQKDRIERAFRRYVSDHVLREIVNDPARVELSGERREITVMFIDIRQFTRITSWLGPERLVAFLNETFDLITGQLLEQGVTVDKYIGDGILAYAGAPIPGDDHARRAVAAAIAIQRSIDERNRKLEAQSAPFVRLGVGIGIHTGPVVLGNIGSERKMDYTAIGEPVNVASRLQDLAGPGEILVTREVHTGLGGALKTRSVGYRELEGIDGPLEIFEVVY